MKQGIWSGTTWQTGQDDFNEIRIGLCCNPASQIGCYGIMWKESTTALQMLKGKYNHDEGAISFQTKGKNDLEWSTDHQQATFLPKGNLRGSHLAAVQETDVPNAGAWVGSADPFTPEVPSNPINWYLSIIGNTVRGSGFFTDSADIIGSPILCYTLEGTYNNDTKKILITKKYERTPHGETDELVIEYSGKLNTTAGTMKGAWRNTAHGTEGTFSCRFQREISDSLIFCVQCDELIPPGRHRHDCLKCGSQSCIACNCCCPDQTCRVVASAVSVPVVESDCCSELVEKALKTHGERVLMNNVSYKEMAVKSRSFAAFIASREKRVASVLFTCRASEKYTAALLGGLLANVVLIPASTPCLTDIVSIVSQSRPDLIITDDDESVSSAFPNTVCISSCFGVTNAEPVAAPSPRSGPVCVLFTSGSTGSPKGAGFSEDLCLPTEGTTTVYPYLRYDIQDYDPTYLLSLLSTVQCGGSRYQGSGCDAVNMVRDMKKVRPTHFGAPPGVWAALRKEWERTKENDMFGGRLQVATSGGASIDKTTLSWLRESMKLPVTDLYGCREVGGIAKNGTIYPGVTCKIRDVPELGYLADKGTGELLVSSPRMVSGYISKDSTTSNRFVRIDGKLFYATGDAVRLWDNGKRLTVIDRIGTHIKTSEGCFTSPAPVEAAFERCGSVVKCCVLPYNNSTPGVWCICEVTSIVEDLHKLRHEMLACLGSTTGHPLPDIILQTTSPLPSTATGKAKRGDIHTAYVKEAILKRGEGKDTELSTCSSGISPALLSILKDVLPATEFFENTTRLVEQGCTSITAHRISGEIKRSFNVSIPAHRVLEETLEWLTAVVTTGKNTNMDPPKIDLLEEVSLACYRFEDVTVKKKKTGEGEKKAVVIFGGSGFLGPVIVREVLNTTPSDVSIIIFTRSKTADTVDDDERITRCRFDLTQPNIGLSETDEATVLEHNVIAVLLNAAWVSMLLPYSTLMPTNVIGPIRVAEKAIQWGSPTLCYISSVAGAVSINETIPSIDSITDTEKSSFVLKTGYGQTKTVSEIVLRERCRSKIKLSVHRPGSIFTDRVSGLCNPTDYISTLVKICVAMNKVPRDSKLHFTLVPADFVGGAVAASLFCDEEVSVFNISGVGVGASLVFAILCEECPEVTFVTMCSWKAAVLAAPDHPLRHHVATILDLESQNACKLGEMQDVGAKALMGVSAFPEVGREDVTAAVRMLLKEIKKENF
eukprot:TRINITY_DN4542_c0_g5_i1.p1 TRINITY_DN4542_c0_g5~~TRINITY_DN4542_c0_g5_i1.p1  ORF type:complete len:1224 (+),score=157.48 TRINITY_DN4542_c0_g5_i1:64-3735(+)